MAGRTPAEAYETFREPFQQAISCVTDAVFVSQGHRLAPDPNVLNLGTGNEPVRLAGTSGLSLTVRLLYRLVQTEGERGSWKVSTHAYYYELEDSDEGRPQRVLGYHWHPFGMGAIAYPHLHIGAAAGVPRRDLSKAHLPTGRVALEDVLRLAIEVFGAKPQRADWREVLDSTQAAFQE